MLKEHGLIFCPKPDRKFIYIILFTLASLIRRIVPSLINPQPEKEELEKYNFNRNNLYFDLLSNFCADIFAGVILFIQKIRKNMGKSITNSYIGKEKKLNKKTCFNLAIIAIIDFLAQLCLLCFGFLASKKKFIGDQNISREYLYFAYIFDIFSRYILSRIFLKSYFYHHHILALIITFLGFIFLIIISIYNMLNLMKIQIIYLLLYLSMNLMYSLEDVFNKICLNQSLLGPFELMFYKAVIQIIFIIPLTLFFVLNQNVVSYVKYFFGPGYFFYRLTFILSNTLRTWSLITAIQILDANLMSSLLTCEFGILFFAYLIVFSIKDKGQYILINDLPLLFAGLIGAIIANIGTFIYNEIIIINKKYFLEDTFYYKLQKLNDKDFEEDRNLERDTNNNTNCNEDSLLSSSVDD